MSSTRFTIHAPGVDTDALHKQMETTLAGQNWTESGIERISALDFSPVNAAEQFGFDPALTSELFERQSDVPDLDSRKYRFLFWPVRGLVRRILEYLNQWLDRSNRHKVQAFYNVVYELLYQRHRLAQMQDLTNASSSPGNPGMVSVSSALDRHAALFQSRTHNALRG
ncbi:MAG: hypothetical protein KDK39_19900, partial [Leptospiraceae bacterium]|nr:hypothetical protein [Leptospiraceae bacterium]